MIKFYGMTPAGMKAHATKVAKAARKVPSGSGGGSRYLVAMADLGLFTNEIPERLRSAGGQRYQGKAEDVQNHLVTTVYVHEARTESAKAIERHHRVALAKRIVEWLQVVAEGRATVPHATRRITGHCYFVETQIIDWEAKEQRWHGVFQDADGKPIGGDQVVRMAPTYRALRQWSTGIERQVLKHEG